MNPFRIGLPILTAAISATGPAAQPAGLRNARITVRSAAPAGLSRQVAALAASSAPRWIGWAAPVADRRERMCCADDAGGCCDSEKLPGWGRCRLDLEGSFATRRDENRTGALEDPAAFLLLARTERGRVVRLRFFSFDCSIDAGGMPVVWLEDVRPEESLAWLESLIGRSEAAPEGDEADDERLPGDTAVAAIARHAGQAADAALERLAAPAERLAIREKAAFWLAAERGHRGCLFLEKTVPSDSGEAFRENGTFALSLCREREADAALLAMARRDPAARVREQALFWLAQKAGEKAAAAIDDAIRNDPDTEVKKHAVFALTQLPDGQAVPELIRVARTNRNPEVRERALFWLGQSSDPRALDFIEEVLAK
jgi:hypothetical protein